MVYLFLSCFEDLNKHSLLILIGIDIKSGDACVKLTKVFDIGGYNVTLDVEYCIVFTVCIDSVLDMRLWTFLLVEQQQLENTDLMRFIRHTLFHWWLSLFGG